LVSWREDSNYNSARRYAKGKLNLKIKKRKPTHSAMTMIHFLLLLVKLWEEALGEVLADGSMERLVSFIWSHNLKRDNPKDKHTFSVGAEVGSREGSSVGSSVG